MTRSIERVAPCHSREIGPTSAVKKAYDLALRCQSSRRVLNRVFQHAFRVAKQIRTETGIQRGSVSMGSVTADIGEKIFNSLAGRNVLMVGNGDMSEKAAHALHARGARIVVTGRSVDHARRLAEPLNGEVVPFGQWGGAVAQASIIVTATSAPFYILDRAQLKPLVTAGRRLLLIDLAVPRNINPDVHSLNNVYLYNIDDLQQLVSAAVRQRQLESVRCEAIIAEKVRSLLLSLVKCSVQYQEINPAVYRLRAMVGAPP